MPISFANIPANIKVPLYWVEVDPSMAGLPTINLRALLVGIKIADGEAPADIPLPIGSQAQADAAFGEGSELARMFKAFFANNFANEVWGLPVAEPVGASAATGTIDITDVADTPLARSISTSRAIMSRSTSRPPTPQPTIAHRHR